MGQLKSTPSAAEAESKTRAYGTAEESVSQLIKL